MFVLRLIPGTNIPRTNRCAENVLAILWIGNPASLRGVEVSVRPSLDIERKSFRIDVTSSSNDTPVGFLVEFEVIEEDDDLGRSDERALKVDADGFRGIIGVFPDVAHVFTSEEIYIAGCEGQNVIDASVEVGIIYGDVAAVGPILCDERNCRLNADMVVFANI